MPEPSRESSREDRRRDAARAGLNLSDERVAELMSRFDEVDATLAAIRGSTLKRSNRTPFSRGVRLTINDGSKYHEIGCDAYSSFSRWGSGHSTHR